MKALDIELEDLKNNLEDLTFHEIIRSARYRTGIIQYRAAEFLGITVNRLKNLESGYIRSNPRWDEVEKISEFYDLPKKIMGEKSKKYISERKSSLKIRTLSNGKNK